MTCIAWSELTFAELNIRKHYREIISIAPIDILFVGQAYHEELSTVRLVGMSWKAHIYIFRFLVETNE